jgi:hypothetical protein
MHIYDTVSNSILPQCPKELSPLIRLAFHPAPELLQW